MPEFTCADCGQTFTVRPDVLARFAGWQPRQCMPCRDGGKASGKGGGAAKVGGATRPSAGKARKPVAVDADPQAGLFTDGACSGNPGPGGWGVVWVRDGEVVAEKSGGAAQTTNNRMELAALIAAYELLPADAVETIWSDSNLCVQTVNEWAAAWERNGWKRKTGPVENLDLVKPLYALAKAHPKVRLRWLKGHAGLRWNEHADRLATAFQRGTRG
jgi:ribonuclease HI